MGAPHYVFAQLPCYLCYYVQLPCYFFCFSKWENAVDPPLTNCLPSVAKNVFTCVTFILFCETLCTLHVPCVPYALFYCNAYSILVMIFAISIPRRKNIGIGQTLMLV